MYKLLVKDSAFTCPEESIKLLAITKAMDLKKDFSSISNNETAIKFLEEIGIKVESL